MTEEMPDGPTLMQGMSKVQSRHFQYTL